MNQFYILLIVLQTSINTPASEYNTDSLPTDKTNHKSSLNTGHMILI
jgi:hypothetical protein